jgi:hypothetical protein
MATDVSLSECPRKYNGEREREKRCMEMTYHHLCYFLSCPGLKNIPQNLG